jgi:hypothetical protein
VIKLVDKLPEEEKPEKPNVFIGISKVSSIQVLMEFVIKTAAIITIYEFTIKMFAS